MMHLRLETYVNYVGLEFLTALVMERDVFWDITTRSPSKVSSFACCLLHAAFVIGLLFNPEDAENISLRNVS
jgi:hypothetical protein